MSSEFSSELVELKSMVIYGDRVLPQECPIFGLIIWRSILLLDLIYDIVVMLLILLFSIISISYNDNRTIGQFKMSISDAMFALTISLYPWMYVFYCHPKNVPCVFLLLLWLHALSTDILHTCSCNVTHTLVSIPSCILLLHFRWDILYVIFLNAWPHYTTMTIYIRL